MTAKRMYDRGTWRNRAKAQLRAYPLCCMCEARGTLTPATVADHINPHRGDDYLFSYGGLQSLCAPCHNSRKRDLELHGYSRDIGADGWAVDPLHPANRPRSGPSTAK